MNFSNRGSKNLGIVIELFKMCTNVQTPYHARINSVECLLKSRFQERVCKKNANSICSIFRIFIVFHRNWYQWKRIFFRTFWFIFHFSISIRGRAIPLVNQMSQRQFSSNFYYWTHSTNKIITHTRTYKLFNIPLCVSHVGVETYQSSH